MNLTIGFFFKINFYEIIQILIWLQCCYLTMQTPFQVNISTSMNTSPLVPKFESEKLQRQLRRAHHRHHKTGDHYLTQDQHLDETIPKRLYNMGIENNSLSVLPIFTIADMDGTYSNPNGMISPSGRGIVKYAYDKSKGLAKFEVKMFETVQYISQMLYKKRGGEFSELKAFNGRLLCICDRTGILFWFHGRRLVPWVIFSGADGTFEKPFKGEWITIKNGRLYVGGYGREWTDDNGHEDPVIGRAPMYIKIVDRYGVIRHVNWRKKFIALRKAVNMTENVADGYLVHEAVQWSDIHQRWFFLPRKVSYEAFDDAKDETKGGRLLLMADKRFKSIKVLNINTDGSTKDPTRGFSSFQFLPETNDEVIIALKTTEVKNKPFKTHITIFNINGDVYVEDKQISDNGKYEGIEFINWEHAYWNPTK